MKKFQNYLILLIASVFALNYYHQIQQGTYRDVFLPMAESLLEKGILANHFFPDGGATYPLWGYAILALPDAAFGTQDLFLLILQAIMCFSGIMIFYKHFEIKPGYWHFFLFLPFIAFMSTRMPDAPAAYLLILYIYFSDNYLKSGKINNLVLAGISLGVISNLRSEYLFLPIFQLIGLFLPQFSKFRKRLALLNIGIFLIVAILMLPWAFRMNSLTGHFSFSATNGGAVSYISLGQLPGNKWNIAPYDRSAFELTKSKGIENAYSQIGDSILKTEVTKLLKEQPVEYLKKCLYNSFRAVTGGVYTGEYANFFMFDKQRSDTDSLINSQKGIFAKIGLIPKLPLSLSVPYFIEKFIQGLFIPILVIFLGVALLIFVIRRNEDSQTIIGLIILLIIYKILTIAAIQYEYRHMNSVYLFVAGIWLLKFGKFGKKSLND